MKFWKAEAVNRTTSKVIYFCVAAPETFNAIKIRKILLKVHPEYLSIKFKRTKKPKGWMAFEKR